ncbi:ArsR/SmtB family transcription factor [Kribbella catacumbae]|uniref:ArsR/SmtB family transcription factor n=1 Tax=Kribbella catacumbae TaxID=460086 RepID=UPI00035DE697|nr:winged helix-turn-helix domain-containing protein [Kribbella catacumbae]
MLFQRGELQMASGQVQLGSSRVEHGVASLLGVGKARIIVEVRTPATPSQLATLLDVSLGTVSAHLAALRDAGVVLSWRSGRAVYYELTESGEDLANLVTATNPSATPQWPEEVARP